eukprot:m.338985 g.338985  ORF g.338985 m.338985 type:complete len:116 (+) comp19812_c0_seq6:1781-2128(+)
MSPHDRRRLLWQEATTIWTVASLPHIASSFATRPRPRACGRGPKLPHALSPHPHMFTSCVVWFIVCLVCSRFLRNNRVRLIMPTTRVKLELQTETSYDIANFFHAAKSICTELGY